MQRLSPLATPHGLAAKAAIFKKRAFARGHGPMGATGLIVEGGGVVRVSSVQALL